MDSTCACYWEIKKKGTATQSCQLPENTSHSRSHRPHTYQFHSWPSQTLPRPLTKSLFLSTAAPAIMYGAPTTNTFISQHSQTVVCHYIGLQRPPTSSNNYPTTTAAPAASILKTITWSSPGQK